MVWILCGLGVLMAIQDIATRRISNSLLGISSLVVAVEIIVRILDTDWAVPESFGVDVFPAPVFEGTLFGVDIFGTNVFGYAIVFGIVMVPIVIANLQGNLGMGDVKLFALLGLWWLPSGLAVLIQLLFPWALLAIWQLVSRSSARSYAFGPWIVTVFVGMVAVAQRY